VSQQEAASMYIEDLDFRYSVSDSRVQFELRHCSTSREISVHVGEGLVTVLASLQLHIDP